ncbi:GNAT family N-acetyltransferase [Nonomuraea pusilla]|uniref:GNAT family N-acetyltransferase n=1 Tax=Nonomuraea pusilla TaxID=46177 RepID=UPI003332C226
MEHDRADSRRLVAGRIEADRLTLTPLVVEDADDMVTVLAGQELYAFIGGEPPDLEGLRARYARLAVGRSPDGRQEWLNWILRRREDGQAVGTVQATVQSIVPTTALAAVQATAPTTALATVQADVPTAAQVTVRGVGPVSAEVAVPVAGQVDRGAWRAEVAWVVGVAWQGRGYASEAAVALAGWLRDRGVGLLQAHVHPDHEASMKVAARAGLRATEVVEDGERLWQWERGGEHHPGPRRSRWIRDGGAVGWAL